MLAGVGLLALAPAAKAGMFDVADKLMCLCGCNAVLSECPHQDCGWGIPEKQYITEQLAAGQSEEDLIQYYAQKFGDQVLAAPSKSGFNMTAWVVPFAILILGAGGLYFLVRMWAVKRREDAANGALSAAVVAGLPEDQARRLDDELRNFD
jgi:cytochrome c-type biogenesis protein CcmH